jgi:serine/threonine protein kinase
MAPLHLDPSVDRSNVIVHCPLTSELDFDHATALRTILQDCSDEAVVSELAERLAIQEHRKISKIVNQKYHFERPLGHGSSSLVYSKETGKGHICKICEKNKSYDNFASAKVETDILKKLQHENIISLFEQFESPRCIWLLMEFTDDLGLRGLLVKSKVFSEAKTSKFIEQLLFGIQYLHNNGIIHRNLKIENILSSGDINSSRLKLSDFGLAIQVKPRTVSHCLDSSNLQKINGMSDRWATGEYVLEQSDY